MREATALAVAVNADWQAWWARSARRELHLLLWTRPARPHRFKRGRAIVRADVFVDGSGLANRTPDELVERARSDLLSALAHVGAQLGLGPLPGLPPAPALPDGELDPDIPWSIQTQEQIVDARRIWDTWPPLHGHHQL